MRSRACFYGLLLVLAAPVLLAGQEAGQETPKDPDGQEVVTMANMRSLVSSLTIVGWDDLFLARRDQIGLSPGQAQQLLLRSPTERQGP
jgi:hypothetical protein